VGERQDPGRSASHQEQRHRGLPQGIKLLRKQARFNSFFVS
jgi:hypothetical protein